MSTCQEKGHAPCIRRLHFLQESYHATLSPAFMILAASAASTTVLSAESRADAPLLDENDPTARALGFKTDVAKVDKTYAID
jgi:hypothetical protein